MEKDWDFFGVMPFLYKEGRPHSVSYYNNNNADCMGPSISLTLRHSLSRRRSACRSPPLHPCPRCKAQPHTHQGAVQTSSQSDECWWNCHFFQKHDDAQRNPSLEVQSSLKVPIEEKKLWGISTSLTHVHKPSYRTMKPNKSLMCATATGLLARMPLFTVGQGAGDTNSLNKNNLTLSEQRMQTVHICLKNKCTLQVLSAQKHAIHHVKIKTKE